MELMSVERLWAALLEEQKNIDTTLGGEIRTLYAQWLWETGRNMCTSPLWAQLERGEFVREYAKRIGKKERYIWYSIAGYQSFPYSSWEEVLSELNTKYPEKQISERFFISLVSGKEDINEEGQELAPLHRGLKNAEEISLSDLIEVLSDEAVEYIKVFVGEYQKTYKIIDKTLMLAEQAEQTTDIVSAQPEPPAVPEDKLYADAKRLVFAFWNWRGMGDSSPESSWVAKEIRHAKRLLKMGLTVEDVLAICQWRVSDPFWAQKLTSLGLLTTRISSWAIEARNTPQDFEAFLNSHPEYDYRKIDATSNEAIYARAQKLKEAVAMALKAGIPITQEVYEKLYRAAQTKFKLFNNDR